MKTLFYKFNRWTIGAFLLFTAAFVPSCVEETEPATPVASFQYTIDTENFLQVTFDNFSLNATEYVWDFGDGNTSTEESPIHVYEAPGNYTVVLTASNADGLSDDKTEEIAITDPNVTLTLLAGLTSKTWILQREEIPLGIGPAPGNTEWWSFGGNVALGDRPCILDDEYTFTRDGQFLFDSNNTVYLDQEQFGGWNNNAGEGCHDEDEAGLFTGTDGLDYSAFKNGGDYSFDLNNAESTLTLNGLGAYIGLAGKTAQGDLKTPQSTKTYKIIKLADGVGSDTLHIALVGEGFAWTFRLVHYENGVYPPIPGPMPSANYSYVTSGLTATFTNTSINATTYSWDFGDGATSTEKDPAHTYAAEGNYTVKLTASDGNGNSSEYSSEVTVTNLVLTIEALASETGKIWKLAPIAGSIRVGPSIGNGGWWSIPEGDLAARACLYDDEFKLFSNLNLHFDSKGQVYGEPYMGVNPNACVNDGDLSPVYQGLGSSTAHTFAFTPATEGNLATITASGTGAYLGFSKGYNGGEYNGNDSQLQSSITYKVIKYSNSNGVERIEIAVDISGAQDGTAWWTMVLQAAN